MFGGVIFCPVVGIVEFAWLLVETKLFLAFKISKPMESHVYGLCVFWLHLAIDEGAVCH